ncbi:MAG: hypothetical protein H7A46_20325 [Verrucomicrobiales bacterium]|nr:hypothetical protein [Verrucomicrobiales bacterium]
MMNRVVPVLASLAVGLLLTACSKSESESRSSGQQATSPQAGGQSARADAAATPAPAAGNSNAQARAVVQAAEALLGDQARNLLPQSPGISGEASNAPVAARVLGEIAKGNGADWGGLLKSLGTDNADSVLNSIGGDLGQTATSLKQSLEADAGLAGSVETAVKSLLEGKDTGALGVCNQLMKSNLTPQQKELATEMRNLSAAFLAQKNLSALDGAQGQVATVVNSLRQGQVAAALPAIKELAANASLTADQKGLLKSLAKEYAPGLSELGRSLPVALPDLPPLPGGGN